MTHRPVVFLHIGAMKTGTTYLQQVLIQNTAELAEHGFLFPGETWADQVRAAHDVVGHHRERGVRDRATGSWTAMRTQMLAFDGAASVFSVEFLSFAGRRTARRIVEDLAGADVHVVLTVRDTCAVLPGLWQTHCANGGTASWPAFARSARLGAWAGPGAPALGQGARLFRRALDVPRMLDGWGAAVPPDRLHVVTVPPPGQPKELLWERFAGVLGVDPAVASKPPQGHNPSLGYASADLMRRVSAELGRLPRERYNPTLKHHLAEQVLADRAREEGTAGLDVRTHAFASRWNRRTRDAIEASGARVVGSLDDLSGATRAEDLPEAISAPDRGDLLDAAGTALDGMDRLVRRRNGRLRKRGEPAVGVPGPAGAVVDESEHDTEEAADGADGADGDDLPGETPSLARRRSWDTAPDPVEAAVADVADACRRAIEAHYRLRSLKG